ncbi:hypothetical protein [Nissabacter archeti]|uniref:hypothetical protein n=1 Tax=Nissabacter archeti TaxID=1917880 RepID=UPI001115464A|nr:hypothetical protein [Nissabacter archeti]
MNVVSRCIFISVPGRHQGIAGVIFSGKRQRALPPALRALCVDIKHYVVFQAKIKGGPDFLRIYLAGIQRGTIALI